MGLVAYLYMQKLHILADLLIYGQCCKTVLQMYYGKSSAIKYRLLEYETREEALLGDLNGGEVPLGDIV